MRHAGQLQFYEECLKDFFSCRNIRSHRVVYNARLCSRLNVTTGGNKSHQRQRLVFEAKHTHQLRVVRDLEGDQLPESVDVEGNGLELVPAHVDESQVALEVGVGAERQRPSLDLKDNIS